MTKLDIQAVALAVGLLFLWLLGISVWVFLLWSKSKKDKTLRDLVSFSDLAGLEKEISKNSEKIKAIYQAFEEHETQSVSFVRKMGFLRYNPFDETGGNQSFSIVLLDGNKSGVVITSLHSRSGTRVYLKTVKEGKEEIPLSKEETITLKRALS